MGVEVMQCDQALLDVCAGAHLLRASDQHSHRALADFLEEGLLLGVGFSVADRGDLFAGDAAGDQLTDYVVVGRVTDRRAWYGSKCGGAAKLPSGSRSRAGG